MVKHNSVELTFVICLLYFMLYTLLEMLGNVFYFWPFATLIGSDSTESTGNDFGK